MNNASIISTKALTRHFVMGDQVVRALDGVDLDVAAGEFLAIHFRVHLQAGQVDQ